MSFGEPSGTGLRHRPAAAVLFLLVWTFWLHRWAPLLIVVIFVTWAILHHRL
jgi:hypothetical protein